MAGRKIFNPDQKDLADLSAFDRRLWGLTYATLLHFGCPVTFRTTGPDVPRKIDLSIEFLVPRDSPRAVEASEFLRRELASEVRESCPRNDPNWFWGTSVKVDWCKDTPGYLEQAEVEKMVHAFIATLDAGQPDQSKISPKRLAGTIAHDHCARCTGCTGDGAHDHSKDCDDLTEKIIDGFNQVRLRSGLDDAAEVPDDGAAPPNMMTH